MDARATFSLRCVRFDILLSRRGIIIFTTVRRANMPACIEMRAAGQYFTFTTRHISRANGKMPPPAPMYDAHVICCRRPLARYARLFDGLFSRKSITISMPHARLSRHELFTLAAAFFTI